MTVVAYFQIVIFGGLEFFHLFRPLESGLLLCGSLFIEK